MIHLGTSESLDSTTKAAPWVRPLKALQSWSCLAVQKSQRWSDLLTGWEIGWYKIWTVAPFGSLPSKKKQEALSSWLVGGWNHPFEKYTWKSRRSMDSQAQTPPSSNPTWSVEDGVTGKKVLFVKGHNPWRIACLFGFLVDLAYLAEWYSTGWWFQSCWTYQSTTWFFQFCRY